jgi:hypothetical protein
MTTPTANPDLCCPRCQDTFIWTGETQQKRAEDFAAWRCACTPIPDVQSAEGEARLDVGHFIRATALYVGVPLVASAFLAALILPHLTT